MCRPTHVRKTRLRSSSPALRMVGLCVLCCAMLPGLWGCAAGLPGKSRATRDWLPIYKAYPGPARPDRELSTLRLKYVHSVILDGVSLSRYEVRTIKLAPGLHTVSLARMHGSAEDSLTRPVQFEADHVYVADSKLEVVDDWSPVFTWLWIEDVTAERLVFGNKKPKRLQAPLDEPRGFRSETQLDFIHSVINGDVEAVRAKLAEGTDPDWTDLLGRTPLMYACSNGRQDVAVLLRERGANLNAASGDGRTVLMYAVRARAHDIVRWLLAQGVEVNARDSSRMTALDLAKGKAIRTLLREAGAKEGSDIEP